MENTGAAEVGRDRGVGWVLLDSNNRQFDSTRHGERVARRELGILEAQIVDYRDHRWADIVDIMS